jgi:two-component system cell cycle sensor histidine kinase PleC
VSLTHLAARVKASLAALKATLAMSLAPRNAAQARLIDEQLAIARQGSWSATFVLPVGAVLLALAESAWVPQWRLVLWCGIIVAATAAFETAYRTLEKRLDKSPAGVGRRARAITAMTFLQSVAWCSMALFLWPGAAASSGQMLLFLTLACTLAGWASMGAVHFANGALAMPVYLVTLVAMPLLGGTPLGGFLAALSAAFWFMMVALFNTNYETREKMLRLVDERGQLIDLLQAAKGESDVARDRAEAASRAKSQFLANMSHELRTPLNAILGFSEIIQTGATGSDEQFSEYGGYIHGSGRHLLALINDILDLAKIEAGRFTLHEAEMDIRPAMENTILLVANRAEAGGVAIEIDIEAGFPLLFADERAVRQVFTNLVSNAVKFTPREGRVVLFAGLDADGAPSFGVDDNGVGIAADDQARVFESFGQGRHDAVIAERGTGLGLPIVRGLVEAMGGHVVLESAQGSGTRVTVTLPTSRVRERMKAAG